MTSTDWRLQFNAFLCQFSSFLELFCSAGIRKYFFFRDFGGTVFCILKDAPSGLRDNGRPDHLREWVQKMHRVNKEIGPGATYLHSEIGKCESSLDNSLIKCENRKEIRLVFVILIDFYIGYRYNNNEGGD